MKLQELGLLQVIYTCNAKEFLTPEQLKREIQDEVCKGVNVCFCFCVCVCGVVFGGS